MAIKKFICKFEKLRLAHSASHLFAYSLVEVADNPSHPLNLY
jgi:hypothetical protein